MHQHRQRKPTFEASSMRIARIGLLSFLPIVFLAFSPPVLSQSKAANASAAKPATASAQRSRPKLFTAKTSTLHGDWVVYDYSVDGAVHQLIRLAILPSGSASKRKTSIRVSAEVLFGDDVNLPFSTIPVDVSITCRSAGHLCLQAGSESLHVVMDNENAGIVFADGRDRHFFLRRLGRIPKRYAGDWITHRHRHSIELTLDARRAKISVSNDDTAEKTTLNVLWLKGPLPLMLTMSAPNSAEVVEPELSSVRPVHRGLLVSDLWNADRRVWTRDGVTDWNVQFATAKGTKSAKRKKAIKKVRRQRFNRDDCRVQTSGNEKMADRILVGIKAGTIVDEKSIWVVINDYRPGPYRNMRVFSTSPLRIRVWSTGESAAGDTWFVDGTGVQHAIAVCEGEN